MVRTIATATGACNKLIELVNPSGSVEEHPLWNICGCQVRDEAGEDIGTGPFTKDSIVCVLTGYLQWLSCVLLLAHAR